MAAARNKRKRKSTPPQHVHEGSKKRSSATLFFAITGAVAGLVITLFASERNIIWMAIGTLAGAYLGYRVGQRMDKQEI